MTSIVHRRKIRISDTYFIPRHPPIFAATDGGRDMASNPVETADPVDAAETPALVDHIIERYHRVHSRELPDLIQMAQRVEQAHQGHPAVPAGLAALLKQMLGELTIHMQKEELVLFPQMKKGGRPEIGTPIMVMMAEHDDHGAFLRAVDGLTQGLQIPEGGCGTWRALYAGLAKLSADLTDHIHIENDILFPRFLGSGA
ncbi:hemerythrin domain-containing protein [Sphingopyxis granuli]|uniref:hemerythrin domain-containing protein n=1 Tax=Sphingopyxis granuli TaxID=267128 RepID=UPI0020D087FF|nr:hemerythrin domain-containing protein [Sphingopyxis granuli]